MGIKAKESHGYTANRLTEVEPPSEEGAGKEQVEVKTHGHSYRDVGEEAGGERKEQQDGREREGREAGSPLTPGPQRCYQVRPGRKILPGSLHIPASAGWFYSLAVLPDTVYGSPILQPLSPGPKGIWPGSPPPPPSLPTPPLNPAGRRKEGTGWAPQGPLPSSLLSVWGEDADSQAWATQQGPNPRTESQLCQFLPV